MVACVSVLVVIATTFITNGVFCYLVAAAVVKACNYNCDHLCTIVTVVAEKMSAIHSSLSYANNNYIINKQGVSQTP